MHKARLNQDSKAAHKARQLFREIDLYEMSGWSIHCLTDCQIISLSQLLPIREAISSTFLLLSSFFLSFFSMSSKINC